MRPNTVRGKETNNQRSISRWNEVDLLVQMECVCVEGLYRSEVYGLIVQLSSCHTGEVFSFQGPGIYCITTERCRPIAAWALLY